MLSLERFASLRERSVRDQEKLFLAEGFRFAHKALEANAEIIGVVTCPKLYHDAVAPRVVRQLGIPPIKLSPAQYAELSRSTEPQGVLLAVRQRWRRLIDMPSDTGALHLVLDAPRSHGNLGTILRSCEAFGVTSVWLIGGEGDPYDPTCVRATMGSIFTQRLVRTSAKAIEGWKKRRDCQFIGLDAEGDQDFRALDYRGPVALMMGSERKGLRPTQQALCDRLARIPMAGPTDSLNLGVATSLALFEAWRGRHPVSGFSSSSSSRGLPRSRRAG